MLQPRLSIPSVASESYMTALASTLNSLSLCATHSRLKPQPSLVLIRHASHATQGRANGPKDSAGRRLGAKKSASQYVIPGNIIFRQRGTKWFPGENVGMGKDHTIYSTVQGYVRYYVDPLKHPKRRYIGVALEREGRKSQLPTPPNAPSRRRLGMYSTPIRGTDDSQSFLEAHVSAESTLSATGGEELLEVHEVRASKPRSRRERREAAMARTAALYPPILRDDPSRRESNYSIGQTDLRKRGRTLKEFDRGDRWTAWHKRAKKVKAKVLARASKAARKTKGKKSNKVRAGGPGKRK